MIDPEDLNPEHYIHLVPKIEEMMEQTKVRPERYQAARRQLSIPVRRIMDPRLLDTEAAIGPALDAYALEMAPMVDQFVYELTQYIDMMQWICDFHLRYPELGLRSIEDVRRVPIEAIEDLQTIIELFGQFIESLTLFESVPELAGPCRRAVAATAELGPQLEYAIDCWRRFYDRYFLSNRE